MLSANEAKEKFALNDNDDDDVISPPFAWKTFREICILPPNNE